MRSVHNLKPIYNKDSKVLILGSFPSVLSREQNFYYANPTNRFWKVLENLFNVTLNNNDEKKSFLLKEHIAIWDVIKSCDIYKSSDSSIKNVIPNNVKKIIKESNINYIFVNGKKALKLYNKYLHDCLKIEAIYLPSTSSANAAYSLGELIDYYSIILEYLKSQT